MNWRGASPRGRRTKSKGELLKTHEARPGHAGGASRDMRNYLFASIGGGPDESAVTAGWHAMQNELPIRHELMNELAHQ